MNILVIGNPQKNLIKLITTSKFYTKLFIASNDCNIEDFPILKYNSFQDLIKKAEAVQIDIAINLNTQFAAEGIAEYFKKSRINLISINKKWINLELNPKAAKQLLEHYSINAPQVIKVPLSFPILVCTADYDKKANSITELTEIINNIDDESFYFEEYLGEEIINLYALWDGDCMFFLNELPNTNEVKEERLNLLKTKLNFMFSDEKADFSGFITIRLIWAKNDWYIKKFCFNTYDTIPSLKIDFLFLLNSTIYRKLKELS